MGPRILTLATAGFLAFGLGCKGKAKNPPDRPSQPLPAPPRGGPKEQDPQQDPRLPAPKTATITIELEGKTFARYRRSDADREFELQLPSSDQKAKVKIQHDRVKLLIGGQTVAKVKAKERGFKIYRGDDEMVMRVKSASDEFKLLDAQNNKIGSLYTGEGGQIVGEIESDPPGSQALRVLEKEGSRTVTLAGQQVASVSNAGNPLAAAFLGVSSLRPEERFAAFIFASEWM